MLCWESTGPVWSHAEPGLFRATAAHLDDLIAAGMTPLPSTAYDLADAEAAFAAIEHREHCRQDGAARSPSRSRGGVNGSLMAVPGAFGDKTP